MVCPKQALPGAVNQTKLVPVTDVPACLLLCKAKQLQATHDHDQVFANVKTGLLCGLALQGAETI